MSSSSACSGEARSIRGATTPTREVSAVEGEQRDWSGLGVFGRYPRLLRGFQACGPRRCSLVERCG